MNIQPTTEDPLREVPPEASGPFTEVKDLELVKVRRRQITSAAVSLFARNGFHPTPVRDIARAAGVSAGSIYTYFPSKDHILEYACETLAEEFTRQIRTMEPPREETNVLARFRFAFATLVQLMDEHSDLGLTIYRETASLNPATRERITRVDLAIRDIFQAILDEAISAGALPRHDTMLRAQTTVFLAHMWVLKRWWLRTHLGMQAYIAEQLRILLGDATDQDGAILAGRSAARTLQLTSSAG